MKTEKYILNTSNQLIDINEQFSSFVTTYSVACQNDQDEFEYTIVNQKKLDTIGAKIYFKKAVGSIEDSFTITNQPSFDNWYLILKAAKPTNCTVSTEITTLDDPEPVSVSVPSPSVRNSSSIGLPSSSKSMPPKSKSSPKSKPKPTPTSDDDESDLDAEEEDEDFAEADADADDEDKSTSSSQPWYKSTWLKIGLLGLAIVIVVGIILWWSGGYKSIPFLKKIMPASAAVSVASVTSTIPCPVHVPQQAQYAPHAQQVPSRPPPPLPPPPPPIPSSSSHLPSVDAPTLMPLTNESFANDLPIEKPSKNDLDFINHMRELKIG